MSESSHRLQQLQHCRGRGCAKLAAHEGAQGTQQRGIPLVAAGLACRHRCRGVVDRDEPAGRQPAQPSFCDRDSMRISSRLAHDGPSHDVVSCQHCQQNGPTASGMLWLNCADMTAEHSVVGQSIVVMQLPDPPIKAALRPL